MYFLKRYSYVILLMPMLLCLWGCPYESDFPLSQPGTATVYTPLLGTWKLVPKGGEKPGTLTIYPFNHHEYLILGKEEDKGNIVLMRAFGTTIDGHTLLNIQEITTTDGKEKKWHFVYYKVSAKQLEYKTVDEELFKNKQFSSPKELYRFVKENITNHALYDKQSRQLCIRAGKKLAH